MLRSVRGTMLDFGLPGRACAGYFSAYMEFDDGTPVTLVYDGYGYVGGWEPRIYAMRQHDLRSRLVNFPIRAAARVMDSIGPAHRWNSRAWSGYAMGVYRTPGAP